MGSKPHTKCLFTLDEHKIDLPVSPFQSLLHTDYIVPKNQCSSVQQAIVTAQAALPDLQHKKNLLEQAVKVIEAQEKALKAEIRAHQAMLSQSALRRMPYEMLARIFAFTLDEEVLEFTRQDTPVGLVHLSHVSQRWRTAALSQSELWSRLRLTAGHSWRRSSRHQLLLLCLERTGTRPLSVEIDDVDEDDDRRSDNGETEEDEWRSETDRRRFEFKKDSVWSSLGLRNKDKLLPFSLLKRHSMRVAHLEISFARDSIIWNTLEDTQIRFPSLVSLRIPDCCPNGSIQSRKLFSASLSLDQLALCDQTDVFDLPFERLSRYDALGPLFDSHYALERASELRALHWSFYFSNHLRYARPETLSLVLPNVRQLVFNSIHDNASRANLPALQLPLLEEISGLYIRSFCADLNFKPTQSLTIISLLFRLGVDGASLVEEEKFSSQIKLLLGILPRVAPNLKDFSLSWDRYQHSSKSLSAHAVDFDYGFTTLIESLMDQDRGSFRNLETLSLSHMSLPGVKHTLLRMANTQKYPRNLTRLYLDFLTHTADSLEDFRCALVLACRNTNLRVAIGTCKLSE